MTAECADLGAHGVVGASVQVREIPADRLTAGAVEFKVISTAVRAGNCPPLARPFACDLSGQGFAKLVMAGWVPAGIALGISVAALHDDGLTTGSSRWGARNAEVPAYTDLMVKVRQDARSRLEQALRGLGADGVVVSAMTLRVHGVACRRGGTDHFAEAVITGTAVARFADQRRAAPPPSLVRMIAHTPAPLTSGLAGQVDALTSAESDVGESRQPRPRPRPRPRTEHPIWARPSPSTALAVGAHNGGSRTSSGVQDITWGAPGRPAAPDAALRRRAGERRCAQQAGSVWPEPVPSLTILSWTSMRESATVSRHPPARNRTTSEGANGQRHRRRDAPEPADPGRLPAGRGSGHASASTATSCMSSPEMACCGAPCPAPSRPPSATGSRASASPVPNRCRCRPSPSSGGFPARRHPGRPISASGSA